MDPNEQSGEFLIESETNLQAESSTLAGMGPRSLTPSLELVILLVPVADDDAAAVARFLHAIETQVEPPFGVMLVDQAGDAAALSIAAEFARTRPWLDVLPNTGQPGVAGALRTGFQAIGHGPVAVVSIHGWDNVNDIGRMRRLYAEGHRIVAGSRDMRGGHRRRDSGLGVRLGRAVNRLMRRIGALPLTDPTSSFRLYDAALVNELNIESRRGIDVPVELAAKALAGGHSIIEIPTTSVATNGCAAALRRLCAPHRWWRWCRLARRRAQWSQVNPPAISQVENPKS